MSKKQFKPGAVVQIDPKNEHNEQVTLTLSGSGLWLSGSYVYTPSDVIYLCREYGHRVWEAAE